jgi:hypothetical protein
MSTDRDEGDSILRRRAGWPNCSAVESAARWRSAPRARSDSRTRGLINKA